MKRDDRGKLIEFGEFPTLETERLLMRLMTLNDAEFYLRNFSDPVTVDLTTFEPPKDIEAAKAELKEFCIDNFLNNTGIRWGIVFKDEGELVGTCGFYKWMKFNCNAEIGYDLLPEYRRKGIMTEALTAMIDFSFRDMGLNRLYALIDPRNAASMRLVEGLGFIREGMLRENTYFRGRYYDDIVFAILAGDWKSPRRSPRV